jgi:hypothetical protein
MKMRTKKLLVFIDFPKDAGCEISFDEHWYYRTLVEKAVLEAYPDYVKDVTTRVVDVVKTKVSVTDGTNKDYSETERNIRSICQEVWEAGEFWD